MSGAAATYSIATIVVGKASFQSAFIFYAAAAYYYDVVDSMGTEKRAKHFLLYSHSVWPTLSMETVAFDTQGMRRSTILELDL